MPTALLQLLADGREHSGTELGERLGISRAAIWKQLQALDELGIALEAVPGRGYRLREPLDLLDAAAIHAALAGQLELASLEVFSRIDSTNAFFLSDDRPTESNLRVALAEQQTAGRGRRGRAWVSPFAGNIYCSIKRQFPCGLEGLSGLSLVVGLAIAQALEALGIAGVQLKWPNDLRADGHKLGGVLIELAGDAGGPCTAVVGFGINVKMPSDSAQTIDQLWTDLRQLHSQLPSRNTIVAGILLRLAQALAQFAEEGFAPFAAAWSARDEFRGRPVQITGVNVQQSGIAVGVDERGALLLDTDSGRRAIVAGEVSLRGSA
ncbi:bifunctional biotin--[acetyl-CoA-carboxylase] ligase/biotin operon repressor BirA [Permianibacter sp. IMCC34836]|nr:bifunctional biotin--[acetyl-CoA-carboxylase] ligase/biotin operon repressor BirA [Permianibacter fluminis]